MSVAYKLPAVLDFRAAAPLRESLLAQRGQPLTLDAADVERIGGQCIQVLIAAQRTWAQDGRTFCIEGISGEMRRALRFVGLQSFFTESVAL